jgi:hypothetical protein
MEADAAAMDRRLQTLLPRERHIPSNSRTPLHCNRLNN